MPIKERFKLPLPDPRKYVPPFVSQKPDSDGSIDDCTWASGLMLVATWTTGEIVTTKVGRPLGEKGLAQLRQQLREASGDSGASSLLDLAAGVQAIWGAYRPLGSFIHGGSYDKPYTFEKLWNRLSKNSCAVLQGQRPADASKGKLYPTTGPHAVFVLKAEGDIAFVQDPMWPYNGKPRVSRVPQDRAPGVRPGHGAGAQLPRRGSWQRASGEAGGWDVSGPMTATSMADAYPSEESGWRRWLLPLVVLVIVVAQAGILALVALNDQNTSRFGPETGPDIPLVAGAVFLISLLTAMPALLAIGFIATERNRAEAAAITEARHHGWHESIGEIRSWYADVFARGRYTVPVSLATATMAVAWGALYVETLDWGRSERTVFELIQPASAAFLGSYFFASWFLVKRYIGGDLGPQTYLHVAIRTWMAVMLALALQVVFSAASSGTLAVVAFVGGVVPSSMYEIVSDYALEAVGRLTTRQSRSSARITSIEGIDVWKEARLSEEGVDNIQNLAMEDPTRLTVVTREGWLRIPGLGRPGHVADLLRRLAEAQSAWDPLRI